MTELTSQTRFYLRGRSVWNFVKHQAMQPLAATYAAFFHAAT